MYIFARMNSKQSKKVQVDISFCEKLVEPYRTAFAKEFSRFAEGYSSQTAIYSARRVLRYWFEKEELFSLPSMYSEDQFTLIKNLRRDYYRSEYSRGKKLITVNNEWMNFISFMKKLSMAGLFKELKWESQAISPLNSGKVRVTAGNVKTLYEQSVTSSKRNVEENSFHNDLLEPVSIHLSNEAYLNEYSDRLRSAIDNFRSCALRDINHVNRLFEVGESFETDKTYRNLKKCLDTNTDHSEVKILERRGSLKRFFSNDTKDKFIPENILAIINHEMGGYPKPERSQTGSNANRVMVTNGPGYWAHVFSSGKNKVLPYIGVLTPESIVAFIVFLLIDNPSINVESLCESKLYDENGLVVLLQSSGEGKDNVRIRVDKPRSGHEKFSIASKESVTVLKILIKMTEKIRSKLIADGRLEEASYLLVGGNSNDYRYGRITSRAIRQSFKTESRCMKNYGKEMVNRRSSFLDRHEELKPWSRSATLSSLRVSRGVLEWIVNGGDLVKVAKTLGHRNINITINNYLPKSIQSLIHQRKIRMHQNALIVSASIDSNFLLDATDFNCEEELMSFLDNNFSGSGESFSVFRNIKNFLSEESSVYIDNKLKGSGKLLIQNDPRLFACAIIYREYLRSKFHDVHLVGLRRFWAEFIDAALGDLPDSLVDLKILAVSAKKIADKLMEKKEFTFNSLGLKR